MERSEILQLTIVFPRSSSCCLGKLLLSITIEKRIFSHSRFIVELVNLRLSYKRLEVTVFAINLNNRLGKELHMVKGLVCEEMSELIFVQFDFFLQSTNLSLKGYYLSLKLILLVSVLSL